jgi:hypothetical protein
VTLRVKEEVPVVVGLPLICPALFKLRPAGKEPALTAQVYGLVPPLADKVAEYAVPVWPFGNEDVLICRVPPVTVMLRLTVALCAGELESLTLTVNEEFPTLVGVPVISPPLLRLRPVGKDPDDIDQVRGAVPPEAVNATE